MRPLDLDFKRRRGPGVAGWLLLGVGLAAAGVVGFEGQRIDAESSRYEAMMRRIGQSLPGAVPAPSRAVAQQQDSLLEAMSQARKQIDVPWGTLFATLEASSIDEVALLSLAPDARKGVVRIVAEARDLSAMLEFHRRLESAGGLHDVALSSHEIVEQVAEHPVRFNIAARWVPDHVRQ